MEIYNDAVIRKSYLSNDNNEVLLVSVENGSGQIGETELGFSRVRSTIYRESVFHLGASPVLKISTPQREENLSDKMVSFFNSGKRDVSTRSIIETAYHKYFMYNETADSTLDPLYKILKSGLYAIYLVKVFPTDGGGMFFWDAYNVRHEVKGSANRFSINTKPYTPCFLLPSLPPAYFNYNIYQSILNNNKDSEEFYGIAYHLSGLHSVLLKGHHEAAACLAAAKEFYCLIIEPVNNLYRDEDTNEIVGLCGVSVKLPFEFLSCEMSENALLTRRGEHSDLIHSIRKLLSQGNRGASRTSFPNDIIENASALPDTDMIISAKSVEALSSQQLDALLLGETEFEGKTIISTNYYQSIVTAGNYLQYTDLERFIEFTLTIMNNPDLTAVHDYLANRLFKIHDKRIYEFDKNIIEEQDKYLSHLERNAKKYILKYEEKNKRNENLKKQRDVLKLNNSNS